MPIQVEWENDEKRLIHWTLIGHWTAAELHEALQNSNNMINAQKHSVNHMIDFSLSAGIPPNIINEARGAIRQMPKNVEKVVVIGRVGIVDLVGDTLQRLSWFNRRIRIVHSKSDAYAYLEQHDGPPKI